MKILSSLFFASSLLILLSCGNENKPGASEVKKAGKTPTVIPDFNADSAYAYVQTQVEFGPRVPNTEEHSLCAQYLYGKLNTFADTAHIQHFKTRAYNGDVLNGKNIIGSFNPKEINRVLLCAHWDSRPYADHDANPENHNKAIDGANDGASGVGVLLEIARQLQKSKPAIGIDIILFDTEDYGPPQDSQQRGEDNWWALGSQYWARNPHVPNYKARFGILLDMVGAEDAVFYYEGYSFDYAAKILKKVWKAGHKAGYKDYFMFEQVGYIADDHLYVNEIIGIPTIDIIHLDRESVNQTFFDHWHTTGDTMDKINKNTLKAVGQTLLTVIFEEY
jgi:hypothetical protein